MTAAVPPKFRRRTPPRFVNGEPIATVRRFHAGTGEPGRRLPVTPAKMTAGLLVMVTPLARKHLDGLAVSSPGALSNLPRSLRRHKRRLHVRDASPG